ncbi:MAG: M1 family metallopeptidase [Chitinophagales bacterium]
MNRSEFISSRITLLLLLLIFHCASAAQSLPVKFTHDDTLRGALTPARTCYDVTFYDLAVQVDVRKKFISGTCIMRYRVMNDFDSLQIDLFSNMKIDKILFNSSELKYRRDLHSVIVRFPQTQVKDFTGEIAISYSGVPATAKKPPWDGGFVWKKDIKGRDWIGVACEGIGASVWWPCKDQLADEPDSVSLHFTVPKGNMCIANGQLRDTISNSNGTTTWNWFVSYPINIYNVTLNIGHYTHFADEYLSGGKLSLDYYVLDYNLPQAKLHFQQVKSMMACFGKYFGPYPFPRDGYKLVETPYWGMEHQGAIAYGNDYINNKEGFDFIIIHESAHEWWGNSVSASDYADLWIHESFATYAEVLFLECTNTYDDAIKYLKRLRWEIHDSFPIAGIRGVNYDGSKIDNDMYSKGAWMIQTFRSVLNDDTLFFKIIRGLQAEFALKTVSSDDIIAFINRTSNKDFSAFFQQYLFHSRPPLLEYKLKQKGKDTELTCRWLADVPSFMMQVEVTDYYSYQFGEATRKFMRINAGSDWQKISIPNFDSGDFDVNSDRFYVKKKLVK